MHLLVAIATPTPAEAAAASLARRAEISAYEARSRLSGDLPRVVAALAHAEPCAELARGLTSDGFRVATLPAARVEHDEDRDVAATIAWGPGTIEATLHNGSTRAISCDAIAWIVQGVRVGTTTSTTEQKVKSFSMSRTVLTGGLVTSKTKVATTTQSSETREAFLYVMEANGGPSLALYERRMNYAFLGAARQASSFANFTTLASELRRRIPGARFDDRLVRPYGLGMVPLAPAGIDSATWKSDLAVALRVLAET